MEQRQNQREPNEWRLLLIITVSFENSFEHHRLAIFENLDEIVVFFERRASRVG